MLTTISTLMLMAAPAPGCEAPWGVVTTSLQQLVATDTQVTVCARKDDTVSCIAVELAKGKWAAAPVPGPVAMKVLLGARELVLDEGGKTATFKVTGRVPLQLAPPLGKHCLAAVELLGNSPYLLAGPCANEDGPFPAFLYVNADPIVSEGHVYDAEVLDASRPVEVGNQWALPSEVPHRLDFVNGATGKIEWSAALPGLDEPKVCNACLRLGQTAFGFLVSEVNPVAVTPSGKVVMVSSRGVAVLDPKAKKQKVYAFPACGKR